MSEQMAEEEDPFGYLITKFCQPISSHILKLQDCPVLFESASLEPGAPQPRDEDIPSVPPFANNAPPEHHNRRSFSSSQEFLSRSEKRAVNAVIHDHVQQTSCVGDENLHFPGTVQSNGSDGDLETHCCDNVIGSDAGPKERMDDKSVEEDRVEPCSVGNLDSVPGKSVGGNRDSNEGISMANLDSMEENGGISMHSEGLENVIARLDCEIKRVEGTKELIDSGSDGVFVYNDKKVDEKCMMKSVNLSIKASIKAVDMEENALKQKDGESGWCSKNTKEIQSWGRRELPLSISGRDNEARNLKGKKRSWTELIDALEVYFRRDDSFEDVDFLETAKRRGLTFP